MTHPIRTALVFALAPAPLTIVAPSPSAPAAPRSWADRSLEQETCADHGPASKETRLDKSMQRQHPVDAPAPGAASANGRGGN